MREQLRKYIIDTFMYGEGKITDDQQLFETGVIDSLSFMKLLDAVEKDFGVSLDMSEVTIDNFASIDAMVATIEAKRAEQGKGGGSKRA
ncbi:MAG: acyl carrier protein [Planctomycetes bacterium]|nr:acyl carrier protein [Planctomycetota bacterium]